MGEVKVAEGTLLSAHTLISAEGRGATISRYTSTTMVTVFIDRYDEFYKAWEEGGFEGMNLHPEREI